jgi:uncharacterized membrane protein
MTREKLFVNALSTILLCPSAAGAVEIVSNLTQPNSVVFTANGAFAHASSFTTGSSAYVLNGVTVSAFSNSSGAAQAKIRVDSGGQPGSLLGNLNSESIGAGPSAVTFSSNGVSLLPNTRYWLTVGETGNGDFAWMGTTSTLDVSNDGWTIGDDMYFSSNGGGNWAPVNFGPPQESGLFSIDAIAKSPRFLALGLLPGSVGSHANDVSANGRVIVGNNFYPQGELSTGTHAFRWTVSGGASEFANPPGVFGLSTANGVSADGTFIVGQRNNNEAYIWSQALGVSGLGDIPTGPTNSNATGISANGSIVVGMGTSDSGPRAVYWGSLGIEVLPDLTGGGTSGFGLGISAGGAAMVGVSSSANGNEATAWRPNLPGAEVIGLGSLNPFQFSSQANAISTEGDAVIVGHTTDALGTAAFRWTQSTGMQALPGLPGAFNSSARDVSAFGEKIVGHSGNRAFIWDAQNGTRDLQQVLEQASPGSLAGWTLTEATAISNDGRTVVGHGVGPTGRPQAWVAYLPDAIEWFSNEVGGSWDDDANWSGPWGRPKAGDNARINPRFGFTLTGPAAATRVNDLSIGGSNGVVNDVTLQLTTGDLQTRTTHIAPNGRLVLSAGRTLTAGAMDNFGEIYGSGAISVGNDLVNKSGARIRMNSGETLTVSGLINQGLVEVFGGTLQVGSRGLSNSNWIELRQGGSLGIAPGGVLLANGGTLWSHAQVDIFNPLYNTGTILISQGAGGPFDPAGTTVFHGGVTQLGQLDLSTLVGSPPARVKFLGSFHGPNGATGDGEIAFAGEVRPSPLDSIPNRSGFQFGTDVTFESTASLNIRLAGLPTSYDALNVAGRLELAGVLNVALSPGFTPAAGNSFKVLDWSALGGQFDAVNLPALSGLLMWDSSLLYANGVLRVLPGADFDGNNVVDAVDFGIVQGGFGIPAGAAHEQGDADADGDVDGNDVLLAMRQLGAVANVLPTSRPVPEPSAGALLTIATMVRLARLRRIG